VKLANKKRGLFFGPVIFMAYLGLGPVGGVVSTQAAEEQELDNEEYRALVLAADRLDKVALLYPPVDQVGMYLVLGERFGLVHIFHLTHGKSIEIWKSKQLNGLVDEVLVADLNRDSIDEFMARTSEGMVYIWDGEDFNLLYECLPTDFEIIHSFTFGDVDDDQALEVILNADHRIHYLDGRTFNREWTSTYEYEATRIRCGDVDGDRTNEIVLNTGQVIDSRTGDVKWEEEVFGTRIELLDMDGDSIPEVLTESDGSVIKVFDIDHRKEKRL
jgi:hypothetical protein